MAYTWKSKRLAYDNIANGSATGMERHRAGSSPAGGGGGGTESATFENCDNLGVSADCVNSSQIANRVHELEVGMLVSDANLFGSVGPTVAADITPTSATTAGYTSTTSWTTAVNEIPG